MSRKPGYGGTYFHPCLGAYAVALLSKMGIIDAKAEYSEEFKNLVVRAFDFLAYTQHVKCSPEEKQGKPYPPMWLECGKHVLRDEIELLTPGLILSPRNKWQLGAYL